MEWMILGFQYLDNPRLRPVGKPEISRCRQLAKQRDFTQNPRQGF